MLPSFQVSTPPVGQLPVRVAFSSPHTLSLLAVICGAVGAGWVVIVTGVEATEVPQLLTHVAVYVPAPTCLGLAVVLSFHCTVPLVQVAVRVAISVPQSVVLLATIDGAVGAGWLVITTGVEATEVPQLLTHVAVYVPAPTCLGLAVVLSFHCTVPLVQVAVRVAISVPQSAVLLAVKTGAFGAGNP